MGTIELNLCEILKGHEGETFYSTVCGEEKLSKIVDNGVDCFPIVTTIGNKYTKDGRYFRKGECVLFPSKEQRDWNKWYEEQKHKVLSTFSDIINREKEKHNIKFEDTDILLSNNGESIDWEHRRYEIAKAVVQGIWSNPNLDATFGQCTEWAIEQADNLINKLKENSY